MVTVTNIETHSSGDQTKVTANLATITDQDTWVVPHLHKVEEAFLELTTSVAHGISISGTTLTLRVASGTPSGRITVLGR